MPVGFQLGVQQFPINRKLKAPAIRWHQGDRFNLGFEFLKQFGCQTDSAIGIVSDCAVDQIELQYHNNTSKCIFNGFSMNTPACDATGVNKPASLIRYGEGQRYLLPS